MEVVQLIVKAGRIAGVHAKSIRSSEINEHDVRAVVLAIGGFQSNLALVRENWPKDTPMPDRLQATALIRRAQA